MVTQSFWTGHVVRKVKLVIIGICGASLFMAAPALVGAEKVVNDYSETLSFGGDALSENYPRSITKDSQGNTYLVGFFRGSVDFDPSAGVDTQTGTGSYYGFLSKYSPSGEYLWTQSWGGTSHTQPYSIDVDSQDNVFIAGEFRGTIDFDPGPGVDSITHVGGITRYDAFLTRINSDGSYGWTYAWGGDYIDSAHSVSVSSADEVYVGGHYRRTADFDGTAGIDNHTYVSLNAENSDGFVVKYSNDGAYLGVMHKWEGDFRDRVFGITHDADDNLYAVSYTTSTPYDVSGSIGDVHGSDDGSYDVMLTKFDASDTYQWSRMIQGSGWALPWGGVAADGFGGVYVASQFDGEVIPNTAFPSETIVSNGNYDALLTKFGADGSYQWSTAYGGEERENFYYDGLFYDTTEDLVYVAGAFTGTTDFSGLTAFTSGNGGTSYSGYLATFLPSTGALNEVSALSTESSLRTVYVDAGEVLTAGNISETTNFGQEFNAPSDGDVSVVGTNEGFMTRLEQTLKYKIDNIKPNISIVVSDAGEVEPGEYKLNGGRYEIEIRTEVSNSPIARLEIELTEDRDWSNVNADSDPAARKAYLHVAGGGNGVELPFSLYVPKAANDSFVRICPNATNFEEVSFDCDNGYNLEESDTEVSVLSVGGQDYWLVDGLTGTGGISGTADAELARTGLPTLAITLTGGVIACIAVYASRVLTYKTYRLHR